MLAILDDCSKLGFKLSEFIASACAWSLPGSARETVWRIRNAGFSFIDVKAGSWQGLDPSDLAECGLRIGCAGISNVTLPPWLGQENLAGKHAGRVLPYYLGAAERAAMLGAPRVYMTPPRGPLENAARDTYIRSLRRIADSAGELGMLLCLEPHPERAIPTAAAAIELVRETDHPALSVLIDLSHLLITSEDPEATIRSAGNNIGYVHIADNDGRSDLHLPLFEGQLTPAHLEKSLNALAANGYNGPIGIELDSSTRQPVTSLVAARDYLMRNAIRTL